MSKVIEIDTSLNLDDLDSSLKKVERRINSLKDKIKQTKSDIAFYNEKASAAYAAGNADEADKWGKKIITAEDSLSKAEKDLAEAEQLQANLAAQSAEVAANTEETAGATSVWEGASAAVSRTMSEIQRRIKGLVKRVLFFSIITKILGQIRNEFGQIIKNNDDASKALGRLKGTFNTFAATLSSTLLPIIVAVVNWITKLIAFINTLLTKILGKTIKGMTNLAKAGKKASKQSNLAGFDTIMKLGSSSGSGDGGIGALYDKAGLTKQEFDGMLATVALIGSALLAWKFPNELLGAFGTFAGWLVTIGGLILTAKNYMDAWNNGASMGNVLEMILGVITVLGGLRVMLGATAMGIAGVISGVAMMVLGFKDVMANGANLSNTLLMIAGILATGLGLAALTHSFIPLFVAAIAGAIYAVVAFGGKAEDLLNGLKRMLHGLLEFIKGVFTGDWKRAWEGIKEVFRGVWDSLVAIVKGVVNALIRLINGVANGINNKIIDKFNSGRLSELIAATGLGSGKIPRIGTIPYLANGAVIPPNRQFLAVLGDQKSGTNIETPLATMIEAFKQAQGDQQIVIRFNGDLAGLAALLSPEIEMQNRRRGL